MAEVRDPDDGLSRFALERVSVDIPRLLMKTARPPQLTMISVTVGSSKCARS